MTASQSGRKSNFWSRRRCLVRAGKGEHVVATSAAAAPPAKYSSSSCCRSLRGREGSAGPSGSPPLDSPSEICWNPPAGQRGVLVGKLHLRRRGIISCAAEAKLSTEAVYFANFGVIRRIDAQVERAEPVVVARSQVGLAGADAWFRRRCDRRRRVFGRRARATRRTRRSRRRRYPARVL